MSQSLSSLLGCRLLPSCSETPTPLLGLGKEQLRGLCWAQLPICRASLRGSMQLPASSRAVYSALELPSLMQALGSVADFSHSPKKLC